jgi:hypothetical protein
MTFLATEHPRGSAGRFTHAHHAEPAVVINSQFAPNAGLDLEKTSAQDRRLGAARDVLAEYGDLEILDHSPARQRTVQLRELGDPRLALGNCWAATNEIIEQVGATELGAEWLDEITIRRRRLGGQHVALLAGDRDGHYVIDYTARQFHPDLPFPYVAGVQEWMARIAGASGQRWEADD